MIAPVCNRGYRSWVGTILDKSFDLSHATTREENGQKVRYIPRRGPVYHPSDAYPADYQLVEI